MRTNNGTSGQKAMVLAMAAPPKVGDIPQPQNLYGRYKETLDIGLASQGRVSPQRIWRLGTLGDTRVFKSAPVETSRIRANVAILVDWSSSQSGFSEQLLHSLDSIGSAVSRLGFRTWAGAYTHGSAETLDTQRMLVVPVVIEVKGFEQTTWDSRRVYSLDDYSMGGTPTGQALTYVRRRVLPSVEGRTILLVVTDGESQPADWEVNEIKRLKTNPNLILAAMFCGTGSGWERVQKLYPVAYHVPDRDRLAVAFDALLARLRGNR